MYLAQKCNLLEDTIFTSPTGDGTASLMVIQATQEPSHLNGKGSTFFSHLTQVPEHLFGPWNQNPFLQSSALWTKLTLPWLCSKYILTVAYFSPFQGKK